MDDKLCIGVRKLATQYGIDEVEKAVLDVRRSLEHPQIEGDTARRSSLDGPKRRPRLTAVEYVEKMDLPAERAETIVRAAAEFERREFLPTLGDIRKFCESYGIETPRSTSRSGGIPRVFKFLRSMETSDVQEMLDDRLFAGPAELGPIAEAIRGKARRDRQATDDRTASTASQ